MRCRSAILAELHANHQSEAAYVPIYSSVSGDLSSPIQKFLAPRTRIVDEALLVDHIESGQRSGTCDGVGPVGAALRTRPGTPHQLGGGSDARDGESARDSLGHHQNIRCDAEMLVPEVLPGAPESGLHLVEDQEDAMLARALGNAGEEFGVGGDVATLAEHRLDDHRRDLARGGGRREQVVELL
ncbi:Uncharacterised protein [Mycobacteroides abscessus subsp. abscessus]|nr:Uncharacterised protein [Mycobacteroides abscessus subsp. abscessus]